VARKKAVFGLPGRRDPEAMKKDRGTAGGQKGKEGMFWIKKDGPSSSSLGAGAEDKKAGREERRAPIALEEGTRRKEKSRRKHPLSSWSRRWKEG